MLIVRIFWKAKTEQGEHVVLSFYVGNDKMRDDNEFRLAGECVITAGECIELWRNNYRTEVLEEEER